MERVGKVLDRKPEGGEQSRALLKVQSVLPEEKETKLGRGTEDWRELFDLIPM